MKILYKRDLHGHPKGLVFHNSHAKGKMSEVTSYFGDLSRPLNLADVTLVLTLTKQKAILGKPKPTN